MYYLRTESNKSSKYGAYSLHWFPFWTWDESVNFGSFCSHFCFCRNPPTSLVFRSWFRNDGPLLLKQQGAKGWTLCKGTWFWRDIIRAHESLVSPLSPPCAFIHMETNVSTRRRQFFICCLIHQSGIWLEKRETKSWPVLARTHNWAGLGHSLQWAWDWICSQFPGRTVV